MPPKAKYTREQIVDAALEIVAQKGPLALTAKELGAALGTSTSPIFTFFSSMQEVQQAVRTAAMRRFEDYSRKSLPDGPAFKQIGLQMIRFAKEEPRLYQLCFMSGERSIQSFEDIYSRLGDLAQQSLTVIQKDYALSEDQARTLFEHVWIHTFGIGTLCATGMCNFSLEQISTMLSQDFTAMMMLLRAQSSGDSPLSPARTPETEG